MEASLVKLLLPLLGVLSLSLLGLPLLVVAVIATHPWLAVGALTTAPSIIATSPTPATAPARVAMSAPVPAGTALLGPDAVIAEAMKWVNARVPYLWGGCTTHGVDCSCLVRNLLAVFDIHAPRTTVEQI